MGLYFQPPPTPMGAAQPLTQRNLTPPISGPTPQNPPRLAVAALAATVMVAWTAVAAPLPQQNLGVAAFAAAPMAAPPSSTRALVEIQAAWAPAPWTQPEPPQFTPSVPQAPPIRTQSVPAEVLIGWLPAAPAPVLADNLSPPISGPAPQAPPVRVQSVPTEILVGWIPPPPQAPVAVNLDPPIAGPTPQAPPTKTWSVPTEVLVGWIPPPPQAPAADNLSPPIAGPTPQAPPVRTWSVPTEILIGWIPPPPAPPVAVNLNPPISGPAPQAPPSRAQSVPTEVLIGWIPPQLQPQFAAQSIPAAAPVVTFLPHGLPAAVETQVSWASPPWQQPQLPRLTASGPAPQPPPTRTQSVPTEVLAGWLPPAPQPELPGLPIPSTPAPSFLPPGRSGAVEIQVSWATPVWWQPRPPQLTASGPTPQAPPIRIWSVPAEVLIGWIPPPPQAPVAVNLRPPIAGPTPQAPPLLVGNPALAAWQPVSWSPQARLSVLAAIPPPVSVRVPALPSLAATLAAWQPVPWPFPAQARITASGPAPQAPPMLVQSVPAAVLVGWALASMTWPQPAAPHITSSASIGARSQVSVTIVG